MTTGRGRSIYVGGLWHETHSFASDVTTIDNFKLHRLVEGEELLKSFSGTSTEIGGALAAIEGYNRLVRERSEDAGDSVRVIPGFFGGALPSGPIADETWQTLTDNLVRSIEESSPSAIFLSLHGAMVVQGDPDPEGALVALIRERVGNDVAIAVTLDFHANLGPLLVAAADAVVAYDTYPHTDFAHRGNEAATILIRTLDGEQFNKGLVQLPVVPPVPAQATAEQPMRHLMQLAFADESDDTFVSWMAGFPYGDVPRMGMTAVITSTEEPVEIERKLKSLAKAAWDRRSEFTVDVVSVTEAVRRAASAERGPVVLVDVADNVGGGSPGDGTAILAELIKQKVTGSVVSIADKESVLRAFTAGVGGRVSLVVGGKSDELHGEPVPVEGIVRWTGDGRFTLKGDWMKGLSLDPGQSAWVESDDGVSIILSERKVPPFDAGVLNTVGLDPAKCRVIVAKSAIAWRAAYGAIAKDAIVVDTPGICTPTLERLTYVHRRKPLFPFDADTSLMDARLYVWSSGERGVSDGKSIR